jgi:hypothetical protein
MATYYLDTSALLKCYVPEKGTAWMLSLTAKGLISTTTPHAKVVTAVITVAEGGAALARRQRMGEITLGERIILFDRFLTDCKSRYSLLSVDELTVYRAARLTQRHPLRGYDAVHLATALVLRDHLIAARLPAPIFVAADANLCAVARAEGLAAENPNDYP